MKKRANLIAVLMAFSLMVSMTPTGSVSASETQDAAAVKTVETETKEKTEDEKEKKKIVTELKKPELETKKFPKGTKIDDMELPHVLSGKGYESGSSDKEAEKIKIKGVTWKTKYKADSDAGEYTFTAKLPKNYELAKDVTLPKLKIEITEEKKQTETKASDDKQTETEAKKTGSKEKETEAKKADSKEKETEAKKTDSKEKETEAEKTDSKEKETEAKKTDSKEKETEVKKADEKETEKKEQDVSSPDKRTGDEPAKESEESAKEPDNTEKEPESKADESENPQKQPESEKQEPENPVLAELKLTAFEVKDAKVTIDEEKMTVTILLQKADADLKKLAPKLTLPEGVTVTPASETEVDFSASAQTPVIYKLTRTSDGAEKEYKVTAAICQHDWTQATCTEASVCKNCGAAGTAALGHSFADATCTSPKTCTRCKVTEGAASGHKWSEATCAEKSTCSNCGITQGSLAEHKWRDWKVVRKATHTEKGKKQRICKVCGKEQTKTIPRKNLIGEAKDNKITGLNAGYSVGTNITFKAAGAGMGNSKPLEGDVRYKPVSWVCGTGNGSLEGDSYSKTVQFSNPGDYTLKVTYERQVYRDGKWVQKGDSDTKSVSLKITGTAAGSSNAKSAANTGDNSPIVIYIVIFAISLADLVGMLALNVRRKRSRKR